MRPQLLLAALLLVALAAPAHAETIVGADETHGQTLGLGYAGLSYDYGFGGTSLGGALAVADVGQSTQRVELGVRALHGFYHDANVDAGVIGGVQYDPGTPGNHALLTPDLGLAVACRFVLRPFVVPKDWAPAFVLRASVTVAPWRNASPGTLAPNLFQSFGLGPNTTLAIAYEVNRQFEISVGGGTLVGMQLRY